MTEARKYYEDAMSLFRDNPVINWHEHVWATSGFGRSGVQLNEDMLQKLVYAGERTHTDKFLISLPITSSQFVTPEEFKAANDLVIEAVNRYPDLFVGMCFVNPGYQKEMLYEIERCYEAGFAGVKLYHQYRFDDPAQFPLIEKCIELDMPVLMHAGKLTVGPESQPRLSGSEMFAAVAKRYPEASLIMAHITGGGDWHWQLKGMEKCPNVVLDISGSVIDAPAIEESVRRLGAERVLFGTDGSTAAGVGKLLAADISIEDKKTILAGTAYKRFIDKALSRR